MSVFVCEIKRQKKSVAKIIIIWNKENEISVKFHNTIIFIIIETAKIIRNKYKLNDIALSGGIFQNKYILSKTENDLKKNNFNVYSQLKIPSNDGGISLGQLAIAANRREKNVFKHPSWNIRDKW